MDKRSNLRTQYRSLDPNKSLGSQQHARSHMAMTRYPNTIYKSSFENKSHQSRMLDQIEQPYLNLENNNKRHRQNLEHIRMMQSNTSCSMEGCEPSGRPEYGAIGPLYNHSKDTSHTHSHEHTHRRKLSLSELA